MGARIHIQELPFEEIVRSAYETLKVECQGVLFGERVEKKDSLLLVVESAHPIQLTKRYPTQNIPQNGSGRSDLTLLNENIGDYHSHPTRGIDVGLIRLGKLDRKNLEDDNQKIMLLVALREVNRTRKLIYNPYLISGYFSSDIEGENKTYRLLIGGYYHNGKIRRAEISVPRKILRII